MNGHTAPWLLAVAVLMMLAGFTVLWCCLIGKARAERRWPWETKG